MAESQKCSQCGAELPADAPGGHCPKCLFQLSLAPDSDAIGQNPPPESARGAGPLPAQEPRECIGGYRLLELLGEGGCGVVYRAEQEEPIRRQVALKLIKPGMDTRQVLSRFEAERQALALMDHPNIARVLDAGATAAGRPFFVMELVEGVKLTEYCDQQKLATAQRLALFIQVCQAIQHAHHKGLIHRDLKPSNILVTEQDGLPVPKVIDFGLAKATTGQRLADQTVFTAFEQFLGTPAYMSPEQAGLGRADIDTRSDIYSLGVLLYELLTGHPPFELAEFRHAALDQILRTIREQEPPRLSARLTTLSEQQLTTVAKCRQTEPGKLRGLLRGDLDWIAMKALEKDRTRRYGTANGLARDVQRHLDNEVVSARPPARLYRFQKMLRRNTTTFVAGSAVLVALLVSVGISTWGFLRERAASRDAEAALADEAILREKAEAENKIAQVALLLKAAKYDQAEALLDEIPISLREADGGHASLRRALGWQHAFHGQWQRAAANFGLLTRVNELDGTDDTSIDLMLYGPALVELGDTNAYEGFRRAAMGRFHTATNPVIIERVCKASLLLPTHGQFLEPLARWYTLQVRGLRDSSLGAEDPGVCLSLALADYRRGDYAHASEWCRRCVRYGAGNDGRPEYSMAQLVLAMSHHHLHQDDQARFELAYGREAIERTLKDGASSLAKSDFHPTTFMDWITARIFLREATALIGEPPASASAVRTLVFEKLERVVTLSNEGSFDAAQGLLAEVPKAAIELEGKHAGNVFAKLGWNQLQSGLRPQAAASWEVVAFGLDHTNGLFAGEDLSLFYLAYAPLLLELGDTGGYGKLRDSALAAFCDTEDPLKAEHVLLACLLWAGDIKTMHRLAGVAAAVARGELPGADWKPLSNDSLALLAYRLGNYTAAAQRIQQSLDAACGCPTIEARTHVLKAMVGCQLHQFDQARSESAKSREAIESGFNAGTVTMDRDSSGTWYDWWIDQVLLQQAESLIAGNPATVGKSN